MNMRQPARSSARRGLTLLEMIIATTMLAMVMTTISVVIRTGRVAWEAHVADYTRIEAAHATVRHIVRRARHAREVVQVTPATDNSGSLQLQMPDGSVEAWDHDAGTNSVMYGVTAATNLLSPHVTGLRFTGYRADGTTTTTTPGQVRALRIEVTVQLPVEAGAARVIQSWVWLRSW